MEHLPPPTPAGQTPRILLGQNASLSSLRNLDDLAGLLPPAAIIDTSCYNKHFNTDSIASGDGAAARVYEDADEDDVDGPAGGGTGGTGGGSKRPRDSSNDDGDEQQQQMDEMYAGEDDEEGLLCYVPKACVSTTGSSTADIDGTTAAATTTTTTTPPTGAVIVTTRRVVFLGTKSDGTDDVVIDGACITLHALSECNELGWHVYCQLAAENDGGGGGGSSSGPDEALFYPRPGTVDAATSNTANDADATSNDGNSDSSAREQCQQLFDALSTLASLNPIIYDGDDNNVGGVGRPFGGFGFAADAFGYGIGEAEDGGYGDEDMMCRLGNGISAEMMLVAGDDNGDGEEGVGDAEGREAMLERLDDMLVVPKEYEIASSDGGDGDDDDDDSKAAVEEPHEQRRGGGTSAGQFDDADSDDGDELL